MFKRSTSAASITALALGLAASTAFAADKPVYGVLMKTLSNPFWGAMEKGVRTIPGTLRPSIRRSISTTTTRAASV